MRYFHIQYSYQLGYQKKYGLIVTLGQIDHILWSVTGGMMLQMEPKILIGKAQFGAFLEVVQCWG